MKTLLARLTTNRFTAALAGAVITAVIQSSSVTTVLVVGFISAGMLSLSQSIGVILGANVGTTVTAQIIAFQIYKYGLVMIATGFFMELLARRERVRQWGTALMGLGLIFFGMELMSIATTPLREWPPFIDLMREMRNPFLAVAVGALFTAIVQSSSATTGIVIILASQAIISLESGIGLILGANVGTCVTAMISSVGRPREALQAAWAHVIFNLAGVVIWIGFLPELAELVRTLSPTSAELTGLEQAAADTPRQIANAHTIFNVASVLLLIGFTGPLALLVAAIAPKPPVPAGIRPSYLEDFFLSQPALALDQVRRELVNLGTVVDSMLQRVLQVATTGSNKEADALAKIDDDIDELYGAIIRYLGKISQKTLITPQPQLVHDFVGIANYMENMGDVIEKDLLAVVRKRQQKQLTISSATAALLEPLAEEVRSAYSQALKAVETGSPEDALEAIESKHSVASLAEDATSHIARRLVVPEPNRLENFQIETDIIEAYKRLNSLTRRIAKLAVDAREAGDAEAEGQAERPGAPA